MANMLLNDRVECFLTTTAVTCGIITAMFDSLLCAVIISCTYIVGSLWGTQFIQYICANLSILKENLYLSDKKKDSCNVCGNESCKRHQKKFQNNWVKVPSDLDASLEHLFEQLLQSYICTWYSDLSSNKAFVQQLRLAIATAVRSTAGRLFSANISEIIFNHLIPGALQHAQDWEELSRRAKVLNGKPQDYVADYLGSKVHLATYSREAELNYLRGIAMTLTPILLPTTNLSTNNRVILREILANWVLLPALDALADPDNINMLIILSTHYEAEFSQATDAYSVPLLHSWISTPSVAQQSDNLKPTLEEILNDQPMFYIFMQHIKECGPVNLLQFFLDIDDLSKRMLNPDITPEIEKTLCVDAQSIYSTFLDPESPDYVHMPLHVSEGMRQILEGGPEKIQELRTSRPLYQAHQEAHALLERTCVPSFHHSYELYKLVCGASVSGTSTKSSYGQIGTPTGVGSKLTSQLGKIRGALRVPAVDGASFDTHHVFQADEASCVPRTYNGIDEKCNHDLTTWRVTIPHVDGGGAQPMYMIAVHSVAEDKSWTVLRRDQDFYALRTRLAEFHGDRELNDSPLPTRKNQHPSLTTNRQLYQDFLQKLLAKPALRSSELLRTFFTAHNLKPHLSAYSASDIGVLYQSMTHKLRKERGQHLDKFMNTFLASTSNIKSDHTDLGVEISADQKFHEPTKKGRNLWKSGQFGNNLNLDSHIRDFPYVTSKRQHVKGACFCIAEAVDSLLNISSTKSRVIWLFASLVREKLDPIINKRFHNVLAKLLSGGRAALVVKLLHSTIFGMKHIKKHSSTQIVDPERYSRARSGLHSLLPWWFIGAHSQWCALMDSLLDPLQNAPFNKHLTYVLLDQLLTNVFPELTTQSQMFG